MPTESPAVGRENRGSETKPVEPSTVRPAVFRVRAGQREFERGVLQRRIAGLLARRQYGKTTIASRIALKKMLKTPGHTVIFGSVKVDLGREIVRKEADALQKAIRALSEGAEMFKVSDATNGKDLPQLSADDFAELYEAQRLEFRLYHSNSVYSRTKVVALTPAAVGETGDLILDEVGRVKNFREVWEAVKPIIASQPQFRCVLTTTPPPDDAHYSFELLAPPLEAQFPANPSGNWYKSELGVHVLRIDAWDAYADGVTLFDDDTGAPISPDEARQREHDKESWDRNYGVRFVLGGTSAVGLLQLDSAQRRGVGRCACIVIHDDLDFSRAIAFLTQHLGSGPAGIGFDIATTEKESSNPSAVTVMEREGTDLIGVTTFVWKTRDPDLAKERLRR
ncbi:MAG TPA: terminase family protein, partial [Chthoniobacterales bacterium]|nr:terminase family protein [Chthoniobacterales bacterium]